MADPKHRGRVQAQGGKGKNNIEESVNWANDVPPTRSDGLRYLTDLHEKLSPADQKIRESAFEKARSLADRAAENGGLAAPHKASFPRLSLKDGQRVDVEVITGMAFVPDPKQVKGDET